MTPGQKKASIWLIIAAMFFVPFKLSVCPETRIQIRGNDGRPVPGAKVYRNWESFTTGSSGKEVVQVGEDGLALFGKQRAWASGLGLIFHGCSRVMSPHTSSGTLVFCQVVAPGQRHFVNKPDPSAWISRSDAGEEVVSFHIRGVEKTSFSTTLSD